MASRPSRRAVLLGGGRFAVAAAAGALLAACGGDDDDGGGDGGDALGDDVVLGAFFGFNEPVLAAGIEQRAVFGLLDGSGPVGDGSPAELTFSLEDASGAAVLDGVAVARHQAELPRPYYPLRFTVDGPGQYVAVTEVDGRRLEAAFLVSGRAEVAIPQVGDELPGIPTPTTAQARGVDPLCTRDPVCPLHETSLDEALADGRPVALLVSTPAFCQTAICGPVLDVLLARRDEAPADLALLHAEVYTDDSASQLAPVVQALELPYEPALFVAGGDGIVVARLDNVFDAEEMRAALAAVG